jgi:hypothetical protein
MSKAKLQLFINDSRLPDPDKHFWEGVLVLLDDTQGELLFDFIENDEYRLGWLTENIKLKKEALAIKDVKLLDKILESEKQELSEL